MPTAGTKSRTAAKVAARAKVPATQPGMSALEVNGHANGATAGPEPPAAGTPDGKLEEGEAKDGREWEKLPKQDEAAASLLSDSSLPSDLDWIDPKLVQFYEEMGRPGFTETAQVHPLHFTKNIGKHHSCPSTVSHLSCFGNVPECIALGPVAGD